MGFSIGRFLGKIAGPIIGAVVRGPVGAILGAGVTAGLTRPAIPVGRQLAPVAAPVAAPAMTSVVPTPGGGVNIDLRLGAPQGFAANGFGVTRRRAGFVGGVARAVSPFFGAGAGAGFVISEILQRARENSGQRVTKNKVIDSAKHCGIELTADTFGLSESDVCKVIVAGRSRRRRGISAADVRRTKRTLRFVRTIRADFKKVRL